jgi:hypothetical protein
LRVADHLDLTAGDGAFAQHTNALVIERIPFPAGIRHLQVREFFFGQEVRIHRGAPGVNPNPPRCAISLETDAGIGENLIDAAPPLVSASQQRDNIIRIFPTER